MTTKKTSVADIEATIRQAQAALATATPEERPDIEAQIGQKTAELNSRTQSDRESHEAIRRERDQLLAEKRATDQEKVLREMAGTLAAGAKAEHDAHAEEQGRWMQAILNEELEKRGLTAGTHISDVLTTTLGQMRGGVKTPPPVSEHPQTIYTDRQPAGNRQQAPAQLRHGRGETASRSRLISAIGRKALGLCGEQEIIDIQRELKIDAGYKAMAEGAGADSSVSGPGGGYVVAPEYDNSMIEFLYARNILRAAGVTIVPMKSNIYKEPRRATTSTPAAVGETQPLPVSKPTYSQLILTAKKRTVFVAISSELVADSDPSVEVDVRTDMGEELALFEDYDMLLGVSSAVNSAGILTAAAGATVILPTNLSTGDALSYEIVIDIRTNLNKANVVTRNRFWVCSPDITGEISKVKSPGNNYVFADNGFSIPNSMINPDMPANRKMPVGTMLGWPVYETSQIPLDASTYSNPTGLLALVEGSEVKIGQRGEILLDASKEGTYVDGSGNVQSAFQNDEVLYRAILRSDVGLRHGVGVAVRKGIIAS